MAHYQVNFNVENVHQDGVAVGFYGCRFFESQEKTLSDPDDYELLEAEALTFILGDESIFVAFDEKISDIIENDDINIVIEGFSEMDVTQIPDVPPGLSVYEIEE